MRRVVVPNGIEPIFPSCQDGVLAIRPRDRKLFEPTILNVTNPEVRMNCINCQKVTSNPKYCSRSCSAVISNRISPKRRPEGQCLSCNVSISTVHRFCSKCAPIKPTRDMTLQEAVYVRHGRPSAFALVRTRARSIAKRLHMTSCAFCDYNKHVEIAHIRAISDFSLDTMLSIVNDPDNLIALCRNCHWELDHGLLKVGHNGYAPFLTV